MQATSGTETTNRNKPAFGSLFGFPARTPLSEADPFDVRGEADRPPVAHSVPLRELPSRWSASAQALRRPEPPATEVSGTVPDPGPIEDVLLRLAVGMESDLAGTLVRLRDALGARGACFFEDAGGDPLIVASAGDLQDLPVAGLKEFLACGGSAPASGEVTTLPGNVPLSGIVLPSAEGRRVALIVWGGESMGGAGIEPLLRVILQLVDHLQRRCRPVAGEQSTGGEGPLVFPQGYVPGHSAAMLELYAEMRPLVLADVPVLILGETGVGKEQLAHVLHASSARRGGPFVAVNCAAIPADLLEAEMFGIGKGVATGVSERPGKFQLAEGGTLFLDEIGDMSPALQAKLLRALQGREIQPVGGTPRRVDTRVVTATNTDLDEKLAQAQFRRDLYYRVAGFVLRVPPLRERREDIPELVQALLCVFAHETGKSIPGFTASALRALSGYAWPGNIRELEHEVLRLAYLCPDGQAVDWRMLSKKVLASSEAEGDTSPSSLALDANIDHLERCLIRDALARVAGKRSAAARLLGISRNGMAMKMKRHGLGASRGRLEP